MKHVKAEKELLRLNRELRAISDCNQAIVHSTDEQTLFNDACRIMCDVVGYRMSWVGVVDHDEAKSVRPVAWCGADNGYLEKANITWADTEFGRGPTGTAARTGKTDFCQDFATDPKTRPWREEALVRGFRSSIAIPLFDRDGNVFAAFTLYSGEPNGFTPVEVRLLEELSEDLAFGIGVLRSKKERETAEQSLRESEEKYRNLFDNMTEAFGLGEIILDGSGKPYDFRFLEVNRAWEELVRLPREKVVGKSYREVVPAAKQRWIDTYARVALTGDPTTFEYHYRLTGRWFQAYTYSPRKGQFAYIFADITQRKLAEKQAVRQKAIQEAINGTLEATMTTATEEDLGRTCLSIAERLTESKFGFIGKVNSPGRLDDIAISDPGWDACKIETPVGHGRLPLGFTVHGIYGRVLLDGKAFFTNDPASHPDHIGLPDGHPPLTSFLGVPLISKGRTIGMFALGNRDGGYRAEDLEAAEALAPAIVEALERKRAEAEIAHVASFPELNPNPIVELNAAGNITYANPAARGRLPDLAARGPSHPFLANWETVVKTLLNEKTFLLAREVEIGDVWYDQTVTYVPSTRNFRIYGRDITKRKLAEEALRQNAANLAASNKELEAFSYSVSHDLRAPLRHIQGFGQAVVEDYGDKLDEQGKDYLKRIQKSAETMGDLIDCLLSLSRITRQDMQADVVDLSGMAREIAVELQAMEPHRASVFVIAPRVAGRGDARLLRVALENLLGNAWKFTSKKENARIEFGTLKHVGRTEYFVRDNGAGFEMSYATKLFQPFQRLHTADDFTGTGIGLATVQRIIRRHGGEVWAEGEVGKGATFYFTLG